MGVPEPPLQKEEIPMAMLINNDKDKLKSQGYKLTLRTSDLILDELS